MKTTIATITAILLVGSITSFVSAEGVPAWVKNNAGWWADGTISESEFIQGIQFLIKDGVIVIPTTEVSAEKSTSNPSPGERCIARPPLSHDTALFTFIRPPETV